MCEKIRKIPTELFGIFDEQIEKNPNFAKG